MRYSSLSFSVFWMGVVALHASTGFSGRFYKEPAKRVGLLLAWQVVTIQSCYYRDSESVSAPKTYRQAIAYVLSSPWRH